jgi:hypothetical protein
MQDGVGLGVWTGEGLVAETGGLAGLGVGQALAFAVEDELGVVNKLHAVGSGKLLRAFADKVDVRALFQNETCGLDGVAETLDAGYATGLHAATVHEQGVKLDAAIGGEEAAAAGVESWVVFKDADGGLHGIDGGAAEREDAVAGFEGCSDTGLVGIRGIGGDGPGAAMDEESGIVSGWGGHGSQW